MSDVIHPKLKGLLWLAAALGVAFIAVLLFALGLRQIPRSLEARLGEKMISFPPSQICHRPDSVLILNGLVSRLYPANDEERRNPVSVQVLREGPLNAFASLGPRIYVYDTLIQKAHSPDELAGVLAHEMGHVQERHVLDHLAFRILLLPLWGMTSKSGMPVDPRMLDALAQMKYTRAQEYDADVDGLVRLQKASIDTKALSEFFERLGSLSSTPAMLSDHPSPESRAKLALLYVVKDPKPALTDAEWATLREVCQD